ncbi:MAG TPA: hypothetical protein VM243_02810 [Phycisphaerae bacterium]|nr:hypothetical protein [Phycisphaerae bacterium]
MWAMLLTTMVFALPVGQAQTAGPPASRADSPQAAADEPDAQEEGALEGIWPTERMIESMIRRWALEATEVYELDDEQQEQVEARMLDRGTRFLRENRRDLQPLVNEFFEARLAVEPPSPEQVQEWSSRALPVFDRIRTEIEEANDDIRPLLSPAQKARFEAEAAKMKMGLDGMRTQIAQWKEGEFAKRDWWDPPRKAEARPTSQPVLARDGVRVPDQIAMELSAWDRYVARFAETHQLDEAQRRTAKSVLDEVKERARAHRERHEDELFKLERQIALPKAEQAGDVVKELERLYGPIDKLFRELEERLNRLPTQTQRRAASQPAVE